MVAVSARKHFVAVYRRDPESDAWIVEIKGLPGCHTFGRTLRQTESRIEEALALWLDREPTSFDITPLWPRELVDVACEVSSARATASAASEQAARVTSAAAKKLQRMGLSRRDTADVLGISHQRVQQLLVR